jgi:altronate dehydratase large subunit
MNEHQREPGFLGYRRNDGSAGVRDILLILPTCVCSAQCAINIAAAAGGDAVSFFHQHGCAQLEFDRIQTARTLIGTGLNPNVAAVLVVGLGCENVTAAGIAGAIAASGKPVASVVIQEEGGTERAQTHGVNALRWLRLKAGRPERTWIGLRDLVLGTECGGSDALSGLTANPAVGWVADRVVSLGGTVILSETTELIGAEHLIAARAASPCAGDTLLTTVRGVEETIRRTGVDLRGTQPAPGNIQGGLSTIEEKSLGCVYKAGTSPLCEAIPYAARPEGRGLVFMDTPGHDVESVTGMVAGGAQIVLFTTGRGTPTGSPVAPVIKVSTSDRLWSSMAPNLDFNAGGIAGGRETVASAGAKLLDLTLAVASGAPVKAETLGHREFAIYRLGPTV